MLSQCVDVKQAVVLAKERIDKEGSVIGDKYIVGYYVADSKLDHEILLEELSSKLPEYMVPSILVHLDKLPLTINGKLDSRALPNAEFENADKYIAPRNELEQKIVLIYAEVLGLSKDKIGIEDDFFRLGGNSISAIRLVNRINNAFKATLKVSDVFVNSTVEKITNRMIQTKGEYQPIIKLNNTYDKPNMFMIHPGHAGCEVYTNLADKFKDIFSCYGVDYYNLYHKDKLMSLNEVAKNYLHHMQKVMADTRHDNYVLLGWSLGGQIALEIASILELNGIFNIKVYLLDTILFDNQLIEIINKPHVLLKEKQQLHELFSKADPSYLIKLLENFEAEYSIAKQAISSKLLITEIVLFKAMLINPTLKDNIFKEMNEKISLLYDNNIGAIHSNKSKITIVNVKNAHHANILECEFLVDYIINSK
ncbi:MAG: phosphopantetheine-binding protein [Neisseriaceae bacterium]